MSRTSRTGLTLRAAVMFFALLSGSAGAQRIGRDARDNGVALDHRAALERVVKKLKAQFPRITGLVASARGKQLYLTLEGSGKVQPGTRLSVFRKMGAFKHPVTGEALGHFEEDLGSAIVTDLRDKFLVARFEPKGNLVPRAGDGVRITAAQIRVALLPIVNKTGEKFNQDETLFRPYWSEPADSGCSMWISSRSGCWRIGSRWILFWSGGGGTGCVSLSGRTWC